MNTFRLKIFAIIAMTIDHIGAVFISSYTDYWLYYSFRAIGRLAFPIFVFLIVEGFYHTKNISKYLQRLGAFALISEIPFDLAFYRHNFGVDFLTDGKVMFHSTTNFALMLDRLGRHQNVFFTLFLGLALITLMDLVEKKFAKESSERVLNNIIIVNTLDSLLTIGFCAMAYMLRTDYDIAGILLIAAFYLFRGSKSFITIALLIITCTLEGNIISFLRTGNYYAIISIFAVLAMLPISLYNGEKGKNIKYFFYTFYPAHLFAIFLILSFLKI